MKRLDSQIPLIESRSEALDAVALSSSSSSGRGAPRHEAARRPLVFASRTRIHLATEFKRSLSTVWTVSRRPPASTTRSVSPGDSGDNVQSPPAGRCSRSVATLTKQERKKGGSAATLHPAGTCANEAASGSTSCCEISTANLHTQAVLNVKWTLVNCLRQQSAGSIGAAFIPDAVGGPRFAGLGFKYGNGFVAQGLKRLRKVGCQQMTSQEKVTESVSIQMCQTSTAVTFNCPSLAEVPAVVGTSSAARLHKPNGSQLH
ncbi:hypothetical protein Q8A73_009580 [Channa argus]|nr:hypothetical protein Q8A73_009580 [Channa argus]